jgi:acyl carrier protein
MIPSYFVQLPKLPLTSNGKIDRKALPEPEGSINTGVEYAAPQNEIEEKLAAIWQEVLGAEKIGINDNFFELGGHSLKATVVASRAAKLLNTELPLREIFRTPTVKELAQYIKGAKSSIYTSIEPVEEREYYPVSSAQKRLYIIDQLEGAGTGYNMPQVLALKGEPDKERFEAAFKELIKRHESLRTSFEMTEGEPVQRIHDEAEFAIDYREAAEEEIDTIIKDFIRPFDLGKAPLFRVGLCKTGEGRYILTFDMHHIISDGVSMEILVREFISLYEGQNLPELLIRYRDYSVWQKGLFGRGVMEEQEQYWLKTFGGEIPVLNLPADYIRPAVHSFEGDSISFDLKPILSEKINKLALETGSTLYMVLLAAYDVLLSKYTGQEDIIVGSPAAGRPHADLEGIIGMFVNTLGMRNYPKGSKTFLEFLQEVRENALRAYENQDYQFEELVDKLNLKKDLSRNPLFDTMFVWQDTGNSPMEIRDFCIEPYRFANKTAKFDLTLQAAKDGRGISLVLEYCTKLFKPETARRMAGHFVRIVEEVVKNPGIRLAEIELLSAQEKQLIIYEFNNT